MKTNTRHYLYKESFEIDCTKLLERGVPFQANNLSITVPTEHKVALMEFSFSCFTNVGDTIGIVNNDGECYGHTKIAPLTCPKIASELLLKAQKESRSWYFIINPQDNEFIKH